MQQGVLTKKNTALCCTYYFPRPPEITVSKQKLHIQEKVAKARVKNPPEVQNQRLVPEEDEYPSRHFRPERTRCRSIRETWQTALQTSTQNASLTVQFLCIYKTTREQVHISSLPRCGLPLCSVSRANPASPSIPGKCHPEGHLLKALFLVQQNKPHQTGTI